MQYAVHGTTKQMLTGQPGGLEQGGEIPRTVYTEVSGRVALESPPGSESVLRVIAAMR
jgi:hypothetical protein